MIKKKIIKFSPYEKIVLFWDASTECKLAFRRIDSLKYIEINSFQNRFFHSIFFIRELYGLNNQKRLINWGLLERSSFLKESIKFFKSIYSQNLILSFIHLIFFIICFLTIKYMGGLISSIFFKSKINLYEYNKKKSTETNIDGQSRGI